MVITATDTGAGALPPVATPTPPNSHASTPRQLTSHHLPDEPLVTIQPRSSWSPVNLRELWTYRELLYFLMWRDVKVRYKQTLLGVLWVIIQPLAQMLIFTLLFGRLAGLDQRTGGIPYQIFAFAGLLPWTFFSTAVTNSANSLVNNSQLITKIYFPRLLVPAAAVGAGLVDFALGFAVLAALMVYYGMSATPWLLLLPALVALLALLALGTGTLLSALNVKYRDIRHALPFTVQLWMFASPVIYPTTLMPEQWRWVLALNPLTGIIEGFRAALFGQVEVAWGAIAASVSITLGLLACTAFAFRRMEKDFADII